MNVLERNVAVPCPALFGFVPFLYRIFERYKNVPLEFRSTSFLNGAYRRL